MHLSAPTNDRPITTREVVEAYTEGQQNAGGMDNWLPAEMAMLTETYYACIATIYNMIEGGSSWPEGQTRARLAYLEKDQGNPEDPLSYRLLTLLTVFYRRWAAIRLRTLAPWTHAWGLGEMYAGVGSNGAGDAWMDLAIAIEHWQLTGPPFAGGATDIVKCFDQIDRDLLCVVAEKAGMPSKVLETYRSFMSPLKIHNTIVGWIGAPHDRKCGIPQGCPLSMMMIALLLRPWVHVVKKVGATPKVLADDILVVASGNRCTAVYASALDLTHQYMEDIGAKVSIKKSFNFASHKAARKWLGTTVWPTLKSQIAVLSNFRYLGAHISIGTRMANSTQTARINKAAAMLKRAARLPVDTQSKANTVRTKILPTALYACEASEVSDAHLASLTSHILSVLTTGRHNKRDLIATFIASSHGHDRDPVGQVLLRRITQIRRTLAKHPDILPKVKDIHRMYQRGNHPGAMNHNLPHANTSAPHPYRASTTPYKRGMSAAGPIGLLLSSIHCTGSTLDKYFYMHTPNEATINIIDTPQQYITPKVLDHYTRARTFANTIFEDKDTNFVYEEIDKNATNANIHRLDKQKQAFLKVVMTGQDWDNKSKNKIGREGDTTCQYCNHPMQTTDHIIWDCPHFQGIKSAVIPEIGPGDYRHLPAILRRGIAPAMTHRAECTFWGTQIDAEPVIQNLLGYHETQEHDTYTEQLYQQAPRNCISARQHIAVIKGSDSPTPEFRFPSIDHKGPPPDNPNMYTDGGLNNPACQSWSLGGWGTWEPPSKTDKTLTRRMGPTRPLGPSAPLRGSQGKRRMRRATATTNMSTSITRHTTKIIATSQTGRQDTDPSEAPCSARRGLNLSPSSMHS